LKKQALRSLGFENVNSKWYQIASELEDGKDKIDEQQIKQLVYVIRKNIIEKYGKSARDEIIRHDSLTGYYLSEKTVLILG
jgi:hypothetical protein